MKEFSYKILKYIKYIYFIESNVLYYGNTLIEYHLLS